MGVVSCEEAGANAYDVHIYDKSHGTIQTPYTYFTLTCISHCEITSFSDIMGYMRCNPNIWYGHEEVQLSINPGGTTTTLKDDQSAFSIIKWERGETLTIKAYCADRAPLGGGDKFLDDAGVKWKENKIFLYESTPDWPRHAISGSDGCLMHALVSQYSSEQVSSGSVPPQWIDESGSTKGSLPDNYANLRSSVQNLQTGSTLSYFYKWIDVPDINVAYDREGSPVGYCGGSIGNRKLYDYSQVSTAGGACYLIPTSIQRNVDCCFLTDCSLSGPGLTCDTNTFKCSDKAPCNSDIECQAGEAVCSNKYKTEWHCDLNQPWYPKKGTCVKETSAVGCCSSEDCGDTRLYVCSNNNCIVRQDLISCPAGACCKIGGQYVPQDCGSELQCCSQPGAYAGACKVSCVEKPPSGTAASSNSELLKNEQNPAGTTTTSDNSLVWLVLSVVVLGAVGGGAYYLYTQKTTNIAQPPSGRSSTVLRHCTACGAPLNEGKTFCSSCGHKLSN
jgi:hypothetical protein